MANRERGTLVSHLYPKLFLRCDKFQFFFSPSSIFGHEGQDADDVVYINWLSMVRAGLLGLEFYTSESKSWRQVMLTLLPSIMNRSEIFACTFFVEGFDFRSCLGLRHACLRE